MATEALCFPPSTNSVVLLLRVCLHVYVACFRDVRDIKKEELLFDCIGYDDKWERRWIIVRTKTKKKQTKKKRFNAYYSLLFKRKKILPNYDAGV